MKPEDIDVNLVLIYNHETGEPLGTGFIVNKNAQFITAHHVVKDVLCENLRCKWKGKSCRIGPIPELIDFYPSLRNGAVPIDLTILQMHIADKDFNDTPLSILTFDINKSFPELQNVFFKGYRTEDVGKFEDAKLLSVEVTLSGFAKDDGIWTFHTEKDIWKGFSGSPVIHPELGETIGVVVTRFENGRHFGGMRSLHLLSRELERYGCSHFVSSVSQLSFYTKYCDLTCEMFENTPWPYAIDRKVFVDSFDFKTTSFVQKSEEQVYTNDKCIPFMIRELEKRPIFCVGYYGMGKTTIAKSLFRDYCNYLDGVYPIFISLADTRLLDFTSSNWRELVARKMFEDFMGATRNKSANKIEEASAQQCFTYFNRFVTESEILLILDGIDEALYDGLALKKLPEVLKSLPCKYILTSRKEFHAFFDVCNSQMEDTDHLIVELMPWGPKQWTTYIENLRQKYPDKSSKILELEEDLATKEYGELPERPLFLRMISDLHLDNETNLEEDIPRCLRKNKAAIYYAYICWKIRDDFKREPNKPRGLTFNPFLRECLILFEKIANIEYEKSVPKNGAVGYLGQSDYCLLYTSDAADE